MGGGGPLSLRRAGLQFMLRILRGISNSAEASQKKCTHTAPQH